MEVGAKFRNHTGPDRAIGCNRPYEKDTIPIVLLDEAFGIFKDKCEDLLSETALTLLNELSCTCCHWYSSEPARQVAVQEVFERCSPLRFAPHLIVTKERQCMTDGNLPIHIIPASILECKDTPGFALNQAILYFSKFLYNAVHHPNHYCDRKTRFPCILLVDIGTSVNSNFSFNYRLTMYVESCLGIYGCLWDGSRIRVDPLTPMYDVAAHHRDEALRRAMASSLDALITISKTVIYQSTLKPMPKSAQVFQKLVDTHTSRPI
jgi:hypothetical protein